MKKTLFFIIVYLFLNILCIGSSKSPYGGGRIGGGVYPNLLPNIVDVIFNDAEVSKVTEAQLSLAREDLARGYAHSGDFIAQLYGSIKEDNPDREKLKKLQEDNIRQEGILEKCKYTKEQRYEHACQRAETVTKSDQWKNLSQKEKDEKINAHLNVFNMLFSKSNEDDALYRIKRNNEEIDKELGKSKIIAEKISKMMRLMGLSPDIVAYIYKKESERYMWLMSSPVRRDSDLYDFKNCNTISEQASAIASQKANLTKILLYYAKEKADAELAKSQSVVELFNSIYIDGSAYRNKQAASSGQSISYNTDARIHQHLGEIVDLTYGASKNKVAALANTTAILEAQAAKTVIGELCRTLIMTSATMQDHLENPSEQAILNARRKISEAEIGIKSSDPYTQGGNRFLWATWSTYLDFLELSMACDKIVRQAMIDNIKNQETSDRIYNQKVKLVLGNAIKVSGDSYFNF